MTRVDDKNKAILLRKKGYSYLEIQSKIPNTSKGTLSSWLRHIELTKVQTQNLMEKATKAGQSGRLKGTLANKEKSVQRISAIQDCAIEEFHSKSSNPLFLIGIALYWAEGSQKFRRFQFTNSNPQMVKFMINWLVDICGIDRKDIQFRLYIHEVYEKEHHEQFWSEFLHFPPTSFLKTIFKPSKHETKKNPKYHGCIKVDVRGSELYWKVQKWQDLLASFRPS
jgi:hypothetical protein